MPWAGFRCGVVVALACFDMGFSARFRAPVIPPPEELNASLAYFEGFHLVKDLGYVLWYPNCSSLKARRSCFEDVEVDEVRCGLCARNGWELPDAKPSRLVLINRVRMTLPRNFGNDRFRWWRRMSAGYSFQPPQAMPSVAAPLAASQRFDFSKVDFIFGASLLHSLATGDFSGQDYTVQRWGRAVMIKKFGTGSDFVNLNDRGLQLQRLLTGKSMNHTLVNQATVQHLQVVRIGEFNVLFVTEVAARDQYGHRVEIKATRYPNWRRIMFQMLAKGATTLLHGIVERCTLERLYKLHQIDEYDLRDLIKATTTHSERQHFATNIVDGLKMIHARVFNASTCDEDLFYMNDTVLPSRPDKPWKHKPKLYPLKDKLQEMSGDVLAKVLLLKTPLYTCDASQGCVQNVQTVMDAIEPRGKNLAADLLNALDVSALQKIRDGLSMTNGEAKTLLFAKAVFNNDFQNALFMNTVSKTITDTMTAVARMALVSSYNENNGIVWKYLERDVNDVLLRKVANAAAAGAAPRNGLAG